jgi:hypothetical protein
MPLSLIIGTGSGAFTVVSSDISLFPGVGSVASEVTDTLFVITPDVPVFTVTVTV